VMLRERAKSSARLCSFVAIVLRLVDWWGDCDSQGGVRDHVFLVRRTHTVALLRPSRAARSGSVIRLSPLSPRAGLPSFLQKRFPLGPGRKMGSLLSASDGPLGQPLLEPHVFAATRPHVPSESALRSFALVRRASL